jgi:hypothetical protein
MMKSISSDLPEFSMVFDRTTVISKNVYLLIRLFTSEDDIFAFHYLLYPVFIDTCAKVRNNLRIFQIL